MSVWIGSSCSKCDPEAGWEDAQGWQKPQKHSCLTRWPFNVLVIRDLFSFLDLLYLSSEILRSTLNMFL